MNTPEPDESGSPSRWKKLQRIAFWGFLVCAILVLGSATGCSVLPKGVPILAWLFHPLMLALGVAAGYAAVARSREIDRERWQIVEDDTLTRGERNYAHREAETRSRQAGTVFFLAALGVGALLGYQLREPGAIGPADLLMVSPFVGFMAGLVLGARKLPSTKPRF